MRSNRKAVGSDDLSTILLEILTDEREPDTLGMFSVAVWKGGGMPQQQKHVKTNKALHKKKGMMIMSIGASHSWHGGRVILKSHGGSA